MKQRKDKPVEVKQQKLSKTEAAFDTWLHQGLHKIYDKEIQSEIPPEWLKLIEDDRKK